MSSLTREHYTEMLDARVFHPERLGERLKNRSRRPLVGSDGNLMLIAADHTARGMIAVGKSPMALSDRFTLLTNMATALAVPGVDGVMASADILEELAYLGLLENKLAIGTINRGGIFGTLWGLDDRITAYDTDHIAESGIDGGKLLLRIEPTDGAIAPTIEMCAQVVTQLADRKIICMVEPLPYLKDAAGMPVLDTRIEELVRVTVIASGLGASSAYTWLKLPAVAQMNLVASATSMPIIMLGGDPGEKTAEVFDQWRLALEEPNVRGLIPGRAMLYPADGDVTAAVTAAVEMVHKVSA